MLKRLSGITVLAFMVILLFSSSASAFEDQNSDGMIVRIMPPPGRENTAHGVRCTGYPLEELMDNPDDWSVTRSVIDYFSYPSWILNENFSDSTLASYFTQFDTWDLNFDLGVIAIKDLIYATTGELCYDKESTRWERYDSLGATISALSIDEPFTATVRYGNNHTYGLGYSQFPPLSDFEYAVRETADWLELVRDDPIIGNIPITLIETHPFLDQNGEDICEFVDSLQSECESRGVQGIDALAIDFNMVLGSSTRWNELIDIEEYCEDDSLPFSMIIWPAWSTDSTATDTSFHEDIMLACSLYFDVYSGSPDIVDVMAWDWTPDVMVPESSPGTEDPFTWAFLDLYDTYIDAKDQIMSSQQAVRIPSITSVFPNPSSSDVTIQFQSQVASSRVQFEVFDIFGRVIAQKDLESTHIRVLPSQRQPD